MLLNTAGAPVEVVGGRESMSFGIAMNAKAFSVVMDRIYKDKIGSIVREYCCNAYDSHVEAGKSGVPFEVHLPNALEPWFSVRDFGTGISPENIAKIFVIMFASTKDQSNDAIGAFGLGAKVFFSYTDQYTVTSIYDGVKRIYSAYMTAAKVPDMILMDESVTDEGNGVEISGSVKSADYGAFRNALMNQLKYFAVKPIVRNGGDFTFGDYRKNDILSVGNYAIVNEYTYRATLIAVQGGVGYTLDNSFIASKLSADARSFMDMVGTKFIRLEFPIGEIDVTASREDIEYTDRSIANVERRLLEFRDGVKEIIKEKIAGFTTKFELYSYLNSDNSVRNLAQHFKLFDNSHMTNGSLSFNLLPVLYDNKLNAPHTVQFAKAFIHNVAKSAKYGLNGYVVPSPTKKFAIVFKDTMKRPNVRARHLLNELRLAEPDADYHLIEIEIIDHTKAQFDAAFITKISEALGDFPKDRFYRLSEVQLPEREVLEKTGVTPRRSYSRPSYYEFEGSYSIRQWNRKFESLDEIEDVTLFVEIEDMQPVANSDVYIWRFAALKRLGETDIPALVGVRRSDMKKIADNDLFVPLSQYIDEKANEYRNNWKFVRKNYWRDVANYLVENYGAMSTISMDATDEVLNKYPRNILVRLIEMYRKAIKGQFTPDMKAAYEVLLGDSNSKQGKVIPESWITWAQMFDSRYPLVNLYSRTYVIRNGIEIKHLINYVERM